MMNLLEAVGLGSYGGLPEELDSGCAVSASDALASSRKRAPIGEPTDLMVGVSCEDPDCTRCAARRRYQVALLNSGVILEEVYRRARN
jgi:hypothetical protein